MDQVMSELRDLLSAFDAVDLSAGIGGLQLVPENAERQLRFERAYALTSSIANTEGRPQMSSGRWRSLFNEPPLASPSTVSAEDPAEQLFTGSVSFVGGSYVVFRGIAEQSVEVAELLLKAVFLYDVGMPADYERELKATAYAVLRLSDAIARRARLGRNALPGSDADRRVIVPHSAGFALVKEAVTFSPEDLRTVVEPVSVDALGPLVRDLGDGELDPDVAADLAETYARPIARAGDTSVVAMPSGLLVALRHRIVVRAQELGLIPDLAERYRAAAAEAVDRSLRWMGWSETPWSMNDSPDWGVESFWSFDSDKVAHVLVISDDLGDYQASDPFGQWSPSYAEEIEERMMEVRDRLHESFAGVTATLHVLVIQGVGREMFVGLTGRARSPESELLIVNQPDLAVISRFEARNPVALWKFARAGADLRDTTMVHVWSTLDEYGAYRGARHSFYLSDDRRPTGMFIATDYGTELRFEDARRFDRHGVPRWDGSGIMEVQRRWEGSDAPVYAVDPVSMDRIEFLVNSGPIAIWIYQGVDDVEDGSTRNLYFEFGDAIAYWVWQIAASLQPTLEDLAKTLPTIQIRVLVEESESWGDPQVESDADGWVSVEALDVGALDVRFTPGAQKALGGSDNAGERELVTLLAESLVNMAEQIGHTAHDVDVADVIERHAPLGPKKKILVLDTSANLRLHPGDLPPARTVQEADVEAILDGSGPVVQDLLGFAEGPISDDRRDAVLNAVVKVYFDELQETIATLSSDGLIERFVRHHEAIVRAMANQRLTLPTQLACFGSEPEYVGSLQRHLDDLTRADQSLRFLIEYTTVQPPRGAAPLSLGTFDRLLGLANEIINKGMLSDAVHYGLADTQLSILPSGRLGIDREGRYLSGIEAFRPVHARHDTQAAHAYFERHWESGDPGPRPESIDLLDAAATAEFGLSMTDIALLVGELLNQGLQLGREPAVLPHGDVIDLVAEALEWPTAKVETGIRNLALRPMTSFPPDGNSSDVYPWRFNRELSYVRRPLLISGTGDEVLVWGVRHLDRVAPNLLSLIQSGRLKADSSEMRSYIGSMRSKETEAFNDEVADAFATREGLVVRRRVDQIGSARIERSPAEPLGDVDVLVLDVRRRHVLAVETKDFEQARTPFELSNELEKLFQGEDSAVHHHSERLEWLDAHLDEVLRWLGVEGRSGGWSVEGMIVVSRPLVTPYFTDSPFRVLTIDDIEESV